MGAGGRLEGIHGAGPEQGRLGACSTYVQAEHNPQDMTRAQVLDALRVWFVVAVPSSYNGAASTEPWQGAYRWRAGTVGIGVQGRQIGLETPFIVRCTCCLGSRDAGEAGELFGWVGVPYDDVWTGECCWGSWVAVGRSSQGAVAAGCSI